MRRKCKIRAQIRREASHNWDMAATSANISKCATETETAGPSAHKASGDTFWKLIYTVNSFLSNYLKRNGTCCNENYCFGQY